MLETAPTPKSGSYGGLIPAANVAALDVEQRKADAEKANNAPVIQGLATKVKDCFTAARDAKRDVTQRMLHNLRARRGEYEPEILAEIKEAGGSEIYMMLTANKCAAATAWLQDTLMGNGLEKPWSISNTKEPELPPDAMQDAVMRAGELVEQIQQMMGGPEGVPDAQVEELLNLARARGRVEVKNEADRRLLKMESKMEDQQQEGGFLAAFGEFLDDMSTFPSAIFKGPVIRNKPLLSWVESAVEPGNYEPEVVTKPIMEWERVSPFNIYPSPGAVKINDGYLIEHHCLHPSDLEELKGVEGYNDDAITQVITEHGQDGLKDWLELNASERADAEGQDDVTSDTTSPTIDALQFWGRVLGQDLLDWGLEAEKVPDATKTYHCEVWLIKNWVIKATLNYDPLGRRPYYKASYRPIPGAFWGNAPPDLMHDCQDQCNVAARALANNMAIASGPQVAVTVDRLPAGAKLTSMFPWKLWQFVSDQFGSNAAPISFFQPQSNATELMAIYEKFAVMADEYTGIPRYMTGDSRVGGAGATASGMSMLMSNAGKSIKSVVMHIDTNIIAPAIERQYYHNMKYSTDPELKQGDIRIVARGASSLVVKEQAQQRRNEFLNIVLSSPVVAGIIGEEAVADLLRTMARGLDMDTDKLIPPPEVIRARLFQQKQQQIQEQQMAQRQAMMGQDVPLEEMQFEHDAEGRMVGAKVMPGGQKPQLMDGAPVTNTFAQMRKA